MKSDLQSADFFYKNKLRIALFGSARGPPLLPLGTPYRTPQTIVVYGAYCMEVFKQMVWGPMFFGTPHHFKDRYKKNGVGSMQKWDPTPFFVIAYATL